MKVASSLFLVVSFNGGTDWRVHLNNDRARYLTCTRLGKLYNQPTGEKGEIGQILLEVRLFIVICSCPAYFSYECLKLTCFVPNSLKKNRIQLTSFPSKLHGVTLYAPVSSSNEDPSEIFWATLVEGMLV